MDCFVGLGSNLGDRWQNLGIGLKGLARVGLPPRSMSSVWETAPVAVTGGWFLNMVVRCVTELGSGEVLALLLDVEQLAGRTRATSATARTLDLDLLVLGELRVDQPGLKVPHPRMWERRFVLEPLAEIAPGLRNPQDGRTVAETLQGLGQNGTVRRLTRLASRQCVLL